MTQDRPSAAELLDSVAAYLASEVGGAVPREQRFQVLVAANLCAVVARELRAGDGPLGADLELFGSLLGSSRGAKEGDLREGVRRAQEELARRIRDGEFDDRIEETAGALREHVRRKLEVARPGYAGD